jgi:hypothetical protein
MYFYLVFLVFTLIYACCVDVCVCVSVWVSLYERTPLTVNVFCTRPSIIMRMAVGDLLAANDPL